VIGIGGIVEIGKGPLSIHDLARLADGSDTIALSPAASERIAASRRIVEAYAAGDEPVYGLNTGLGGNIGFRIDPDEIRAFQAQLVLGRVIGVGEPLPERVCRAALLARVIGASTGGAGLSAGTIAMLVDLFNRRVTPVIPSLGSISAGDLGLSAHMGAVAIGRGEAWVAGERLPGAAALERVGLAPAVLEPKDGLALCSSNAPSVAQGALALTDLDEALHMGAAAAALGAQAYGANPAIFDARLQAVRPAGGQVEAAALMRRLLAGGTGAEPPRRIQDAVSFRAIAPILGAAFAARDFARRELEVELNGTADSPVVLVADGLMVSTANFHTPAIAVALDAAAIALVQVAAATMQRIVKLMTPAFSHLPKYLSPVGGASAGFVPLQKTAASLFVEIRHLAAPAALDAPPVSDTVEDHAPLTLQSAVKLARQVAVYRILVALEAMVAAQAVDLREGLSLSPAGARLHAAIRQAVPRLDGDRETGPDVMAIERALFAGGFAAAFARDDEQKSGRAAEETR
jgi:histidine ammonia-lyase